MWWARSGAYGRWESGPESSRIVQKRQQSPAVGTGRPTELSKPVIMLQHGWRCQAEGKPTELCYDQ